MEAVVRHHGHRDAVARPQRQGVERDEDADLIGDTGCDEGQGFLYARPMGAEEVAALLGSRRMFRRFTRAPLAAS